MAEIKVLPFHAPTSKYLTVGKLQTLFKKCLTLSDDIPSNANTSEVKAERFSLLP
jgi:hypothetical protein